MKDAVIEMKNNLLANNSRVDETKNQVNYLEYKEAKCYSAEQKEEKKNTKSPTKDGPNWCGSVD